MRALVVASCFVIVTCTAARAITIQQSITDTAFDFTAVLVIDAATIRHKVDMFGDPLSETDAFSLRGDHWSVEGTLELNWTKITDDAPVGVDILSVRSLSIHHFKPPHDEEFPVYHNPESPEFRSDEYQSENEPFGKQFVDFDKTHKDHYHTHRGKYEGTGIHLTQDKLGYFDGSITLTLSGEHRGFEVPLPASVLLLGGVVAAGLGSAMARRRSARSPRPVTGGTHP